MKKLMVIAALLVFVSGTAYAAEWNFYGSARVSTFYTKFDLNMLQTTSGGNPIVGAGSNTQNFEQDINGNARIGANVKVSDTLTGRFEYGAKNGNANLRILWGEWNFGAGSLGVGQNYTPLLFPYSNQVYNIYDMKDGDTNMSTFGMLYGKRKAMVRLKFGNFQVAAVQPNTSVYYDYTGTVTAGGGPLGAAFPLNLMYIPAAQPNTEVKLPSIQAKYRLDFDWGHLNFAGGYQTFEILGTAQKYDVKSYVLGLGGRVNVGKAYFKGNIWGGENVGNMADILVGPQIFSTLADASASNRSGADVGFARYRDGTLAALGQVAGVTDNEAVAGLIVAGYEIRRGLYIEGGYGYTRTELDEAGAVKKDCATWYLQSTIFLAENVFITPEIGGLDGKDDSALDIFYGGIKWQINF